jgi:NadR type nicotinamide-nucleotide adenylyltransferase
MRPQRVVVTGSECTGKTTLTERLATRFGAAWSSEYARAHQAAKPTPLDVSDVEAIARGQVAGEEAALAERVALAERAARVVFHDTDLVSTEVYARHYYGACPAWIVAAARDRRADLYLLCHPDVPWLADGLQRDRPDQREQIHGLFAAALDALGARVVDIEGPWTEREAAAIRAVEDLLERGG